MLILLRHIFTAYTHLLMVPRAPKSDTSFPNVVVVVVVCRRSHVCCLTLFAFSLKEQKQRKMKKQSVHSVCTVICCLLFTFRSRWNLFFGFFISSCFLIFFFGWKWNSTRDSFVSVPRRRRRRRLTRLELFLFLIHLARSVDQSVAQCVFDFIIQLIHSTLHMNCCYVTSSH